MNFQDVNTILQDGLGNYIGVLPTDQLNAAGFPITEAPTATAGTVREPKRSALTQFIAEVKSRGMARNNRYRVDIPLNNDASQIASLFCESVSLPGLNVATTPQRIYGEQREVPYERIFDPVSLTFYVDSGMLIKKAFDDWMSSIIDPLTRTQAYYNEYIRDVVIRVYNVDDSNPYTVTLYKAYPKAVQSVQLDANGKDIMKLTVTLVYKYWESEQITAQVEADQTDIINSDTIQDPFEIALGEGYGTEDYFGDYYI